MTWDHSFEARWERYKSVEFISREGRRRRPVSLFEECRSVCEYAEAFLEWAEGELADALRDPDVVTINQAKLQLQDKYFSWLEVLPKRDHRQRTTTRPGHICVVHVYEEVYHLLRNAELSLTPPPLYIPPPPPPPPAPPQIAGIFIGEQGDVDQKG